MFQPVSIPLTSGVRDDVPSELAESPAQLELSGNIMFTRNSLRARPGTTSRDKSFQKANVVTSTVLGPTAVGIVPVQDPGYFGEESPMVLLAGQSAVRRSADGWVHVGSVLPCRQVVSRGLVTTTRADKSATTNRHHPAPCGTSIVGAFGTSAASAGVNVGSNVGFPFVNDLGEVDYVTTNSLTGVTASSRANITAAANAVYYISSTGDVYQALHSAAGTLGNATVTSVGTGADTATYPKQNVAACINAAGTRYFVAYASSTAGRITLLLINASTGAVVQTLNVNGLGTVQGLALAYSSNAGTDTLCLAWIDVGGGTLRTKVFTSNGTAYTDAAIDLTLTNAPSLATDSVLVAGVTGASSAIATIAYVASGGLDVRITGRSLTAATEIATTGFALFGAAPVSSTTTGSQHKWAPLFGSVVVGGRTLIGLQHGAFAGIGNGTVTHRSQWIVLDVSALYASGVTTERTVVAHGNFNAFDWITPSVADTTSVSNGVSFCVQEGVSFDFNGTLRSRTVRVTLMMDAPSYAAASDLTFLGSTGGHSFDGARLINHGFIDYAPIIHGNVTISAGVGTLTAGSYSYQATWEAVNARGQVVRSGTSNVLTTSVILNDQVSLVISTPQFREYSLSTSSDFVRVRLWATEVNPTAGAPLYFVTETTLTGIPSENVVLVHSAPVATTSEVLYTADDAYDDAPPQGCDRGVAFALSRLFSADQRYVYASKLLVPTVAPAFSIEDTHRIVLPSALGPITGLAGYEDRLVVVCTTGVALVRGAGYDDFGNGPGFSVDVIPGAPGSGISTFSKSPRTVIATPQGAVFEGRNNNLWVVNLAGGCDEIGRAHSGSLDMETIANTDVVYCPPPTPGHGQGSGSGTAKLFHGNFIAGLQYFDVTSGTWSTWDSSDSPGTHFCSVNGVLWGLATSTVFSVDAIAGNDNWNDAQTTPGGTWRLTFRTKAIKVAEHPQGWGRLRKLVIHGINPGSGTPPVLTVNVYDQHSGQTLMTDNETWPLTVADGLWPFTTAPEFWMAIQRCSSVTVDVSIADPAGLEITHLELWTDSTVAQAPNNVRS